MRDEDWNSETDDDYASESATYLVVGPRGYLAAA